MNREIVLTAAMAFAVLASALHVLIFYMESIAWEGPLARKTFGGTPEEARPHAFYAFNQGFYNLFLALQTLTGVALAALGHVELGAALILAGTGAMLAAAVVFALAACNQQPASGSASAPAASSPASASTASATCSPASATARPKPKPPPCRSAILCWKPTSKTASAATAPKPRLPGPPPP